MCLGKYLKILNLHCPLRPLNHPAKEKNLRLQFIDPVLWCVYASQICYTCLFVLIDLFINYILHKLKLHGVIVF